MIKKFLIAVGLGNVLNITSLASAQSEIAKIVCEVENVENRGLCEETNVSLIERGFPFSYLEKVETGISNEAPQTEFIFANATYNLIFWIAVSFIIVYLLFWIIGKFSKLAFFASLAAIVGLLILAFLSA